MRTARFEAVLTGLWAGMLLCIAMLAAPALFALLAPPIAAKVAGRMFAQEAYLSLGLAVALLLTRRRRTRQISGAASVFSADLMLLLGTIFCTVAGYFAVQPMMATARGGQGTVSIGALHAVSLAFFALKAGLVLALAWRFSGS